jgi:hypothetical protein
LGFAALPLHADGVLVTFRDVPDSGPTIARVDLTAAAGYAKLGPVEASAIRLTRTSDGQPATLQFIPDPDYDPTSRIAGTVVAHLECEAEVELKLSLGDRAAQPSESVSDFSGTVSTPFYTVEHRREAQGGLPSQIAFPKTGKVFENFRWQDRVHHPERGGYQFRDDQEATVEKLSEGPLCTVIRVQARCTRGSDRPESQPAAVYDWYYFHDRPLVFVSALQTQTQPFEWREWHFLELNFPGDEFPGFLGGDPRREGAFSGSKEGTSFSRYATLSDGRNAIAVVGSGNVLVYDGRGEYGNYLHARPGLAWSRFGGTLRRVDAWLCITSDDDPAGAIEAAEQSVPPPAHAAVSVESVQQRLKALRATEGAPPEDVWWRAAMVDTLQRRGRFAAALDAAEGPVPEGWHVLAAGQLGLILCESDGGVRLEQLIDRAGGRNLLTVAPLPLFELTMREVAEPPAPGQPVDKQSNGTADAQPEVCRLSAETGWQEAEVVLPAVEGLQITWRRPRDTRLGDLSVTARVVPDHKQNAFRWTIEVENPTTRWTTWRTVFPQVAVADLGPDAEVLLPRGSGEVQTGLWQREYRHQGTYPNGWTTMAFMAAYDAGRNTGLYVGMHDPCGSTKDIIIESRPSDRAVVFAFDHPAAEMGRPGNDFQPEGCAVWQLLRGDWFDAALIYRDWVRHEARWWPDLGPDGRADTPLWMRELPVWLLGGGAPEGFVPAIEEFAEFAGVPVGVHWYNWHQIPFDNDYPHYFPTRDGFAEAVALLRKKNVHVMPYINGRLWDTRDRGLDDFEFTSIALPAATKDETGEPYIETYSSKETDGSRVRLAVMCPATGLWKERQRAIVLRLMTECHVAGVYIDQIAAARPVLCFDAAHGHPFGGGHWWTAAYWGMLERIRNDMPADRMLTTECNAEPYIRWFDGYLTWHWQHDGQVPAFPAVYGGSIQMFGRAYRGGETKNLALRMKAGEQLVFGEQIGWFGPEVIKERENAEFLRQIIDLRWRLRRYFYAGEMARPPELSGEIPRVTADWQWSGHWPVTTDAVMAGAWWLPREERLVLLVVNVGDEPVATGMDYTLAPYGLAGEAHVTELLPNGQGNQEARDPKSHVKLDFLIPGRTVRAWEVTGKSMPR